MRRTIALAAAATALSLTALTGCNDDGAGTAAPTASPSPVPASTTAAPTGASTSTTSTSPVPGAFDPEQALAAKRAPYSAVMSLTSEVAGTPAFTSKGRVNPHAPFTGRMELRSVDAPGEEGVHTEVVLAEDFAYSRDLTKPGSGWAKIPRSADEDQADYAKYAALLLTTGPSARKGMEDVAGTPAYHLSGRLEVEQIAAIDPKTYRSMKGKITTFDCDQWIDSQGRTLRFEQRTTLRGQATVNKITFTEFGDPVTVTAPTND
ncbi:LppX_LprAFG lipoprotein [Streptomyces sp. BE20]|uniref:LppX_LprAFG lipoprotein n=1 Tax=Streptomyces sp. BE20 TaxID=3002525 RepID=UPI002E783C7A|nr:LppX_LprAFG lipoprotein [Streptomyces sp. BE20]MEE1821924.1 LppX_LprAFG lipoprotein [Streptomyces sp. BE20]